MFTGVWIFLLCCSATRATSSSQTPFSLEQVAEREDDRDVCEIASDFLRRTVGSGQEIAERIVAFSCGATTRKSFSAKFLALSDHVCKHKELLQDPSVVQWIKSTDANIVAGVAGARGSSCMCPENIETIPKAVSKIVKMDSFRHVRDSSLHFLELGHLNMERKLRRRRTLRQSSRALLQRLAKRAQQKQRMACFSQKKVYSESKTTCETCLFDTMNGINTANLWCIVRTEQNVLLTSCVSSRSLCLVKGGIASSSCDYPPESTGHVGLDSVMLAVAASAGKVLWPFQPILEATQTFTLSDRTSDLEKAWIPGPVTKTAPSVAQPGYSSCRFDVSQGVTSPERGASVKLTKSVVPLRTNDVDHVMLSTTFRDLTHNGIDTSMRYVGVTWEQSIWHSHPEHCPTLPRSVKISIADDMSTNCGSTCYIVVPLPALETRIGGNDDALASTDVCGVKENLPSSHCAWVVLHARQAKTSSSTRREIDFVSSFVYLPVTMFRNYNVPLLGPVRLPHGQVACSVGRLEELYNSRGVAGIRRLGMLNGAAGEHRRIRGLLSNSRDRSQIEGFVRLYRSKGGYPYQTKDFDSLIHLLVSCVGDEHTANRCKRGVTVTVFDGNHRLHAAMVAKLAWVPVWIEYKAPLDERQAEWICRTPRP